MGPVGRAYAALVAAGELKPDPGQAGAVQALDRFAADAAGNGGFLKRLLRKTQAPAGVYLWGGVGRGKSMLMDLAFDHIPVLPKRRTHFHAFMLEVHQRLRAARATEEGDPVVAVAENIAEEVRFLAFDEMMVTNSADAMIMSRLFTALLGEGVGLVTTSNRPPADLYKDGLNRELFLPFIRLTEYPVEDRAHVPTEDLDVGGGRILHVPKSLKGVAVFSFKRLCGAARGAADYLAIAQRFHTVIIVGIPVLTREMRNEAARFVTLIDALYEHRVKLLAAADAEPADLYPAGDGRFEFERTVSRLEEMQSADYLEEGHGLAA